MQGLAAGEPVKPRPAPSVPEAGPLDLTHYFPCRVKGEVIAILGVGRKEVLDPLNSEEVDLLQALAGQAATAFMNGRLYQSLREKANELQELTEYNENILESMDSGILVLDLEGRIVRWNRAMEALYGAGATRCSAAASTRSSRRRSWRRCAAAWCSAADEEIAHIYKLHLPAADGRSPDGERLRGPLPARLGERCGTILILDDVTARVRLEEQLQHSEKMASIGLLAAGVAHEVNTPLTGISSYTQMLREQVRPTTRAPPCWRRSRSRPSARPRSSTTCSTSPAPGAEFETLDANKVLLDVLSLIEHQLERGRIKVRKELRATCPGARQREPAAAGLLQPDPQRARRHAQAGLADPGHARRRRRGGGGG